MRRASINTYVHEKRPLGNRLSNISIISSAVAAALMAGPAAGGLTFVQAVQESLSLSQSSAVWRTLCFAALLVSLVAAISANLNKSNNLLARIGVAEACNADLEGLQALVEFGDLPVKDAVTVYRQLVAKIPFVEERPVAK
jgi:MFS family permease